MSMQTTALDLLSQDDLASIITSGLVEYETLNYGGRLHSSSSGWCNRKSVLTATATGDRRTSGISKASMEFGNSGEQIILTGLRKKNRLLFDGYKLPDIGLNLGGKIDGIILYKDKIHVLEIKTTMYPPKLDDPKYGQNLKQLDQYSAVTGLPAVLLYFSRTVFDKSGNLKMQVYDVGFNKANLEDTMTDVAASHYFAINNLHPEKPIFFEPDIHCSYCPFVPFCWEGESKYLNINTTQATPDQSATIYEKAREWAKEFMQPEAIEKRRNGVIKHISENGPKTAENLLKGKAWDNYLIDVN